MEDCIHANQIIPDEFDQHLRFVQTNLRKTAQPLAMELSKELTRLYYEYRELPCFQKNADKICFFEFDLWRAMIAMWEDLLRIEAYHNVHYADNHKKAAHIFKWICHFRPIATNIDPKDMEPWEFFINELFAFLCAKLYLPKMGEITRSEQDTIFYSAKYREIHANEWAMIFYLYEKRGNPCSTQHMVDHVCNNWTK
jgi:hypothetical protein